MPVGFSKTVCVLALASCLLNTLPGLAQVVPPPFPVPGMPVLPGAVPPSPLPASPPTPAETPAPKTPLSPPAATPAPGGPATPATEPPDSTPAAGKVTEQVTREGLDQLKGRVDAATDLTDAHRQLANELIEKARASLTQAAELAGSLQNWKQHTGSIEGERRAEQARVDAAMRPTPPPVTDFVPLPQLEQTLASRQQELVQAQTELAQTEKRLTDRTARQRAIKERLSAISLQVDQIKSSLTRPNVAGEPLPVTEARRQALLAELKLLDNEPAALQAEAAFLTAQEAANLIPLRRQALNATVARLRDEVEILQRGVILARNFDTRTRAEMARIQAENAAIPQLRALYESNAKTIQTEIGIREKQRRIADEVAQTRGALETVQRQWEELRQREEKNLGSSTSFGVRLREQRRFLPEIQDLQQQIRNRAAVNEQAHLDYIEAREKRAELDHLNRAIETMLNSIVVMDDAERRRLSDEVRDAYEQRQRDLGELESAFEGYVADLDQLDIEQDALIRQVVGFQKYIDERILWVPTHRMLTLNDITSDVAGLQRLFSRDMWSAFLSFYRDDLGRNPLLYLAAALFWTLLLATQGIQRANIRKYGQKASSRLNTAMSPTWGAIVWTFVRTLSAPFPLIFLAWRGDQPGSDLQNLARAVTIVGIWLWWLEAVRLTCRSGGLGPAHFQWPARVNEVVTRQVSSFIVLSIPLTLVIVLLRSQSVDGETDAFERCCSVAFMLLVAYTLHRLTSKKSGVFQEWIEARPGGWASLVAFAWHATATVLPLYLASLSVTGYTFAQGRLTLRLAQTLMVVAGALFARSLLFRWLTLRQRRLAIAHAREVRAALVEAHGQEEGSSAAVLEAQEARTNLAEVSTQSKRLLNTTIVTLSLCWVWLIWKDVLPAFQRLDQFSIPGIALTLDKFLIATLQIILFTTAARNIPGLIEITLLERLPLDRANRYAVGAILRYVIVLFAVLSIGNTLNVKWEQLQWLVAALAFSLGFGLQEIFANFISGLIILFEQPIRVGDVVTLDNVTGTVSRIRIRSTSIVDYDRKEYIVPNKQFITGRVLNWTLTDTVNRVMVTISTSHAADPNLVREILKKIITTQQHVLTDPAPFVSCSGITETGMNFNVGVYLSSLEFRTETSHTIYARIHQAFRENGIELASPQRELHLRSSVPLTVSPPPPPRSPASPSTNGESQESPAEVKAEEEEKSASLRA